MVRTRTKSGKFEASMVMGSSESDCKPETLLPQIPVSRIWVWRILVYLITFLVMSPWVFLMIKKQSFNGLSQKVSDFYDDNFSCRSWDNMTHYRAEARDNRL